MSFKFYYRSLIKNKSKLFNVHNVPNNVAFCSTKYYKWIFIINWRLKKSIIGIEYKEKSSIHNVTFSCQISKYN